MDFNLIVTLGPSILNERKLKEIWEKGPCIFRINGAHTEKESVGNIVKLVRNVLPTAKLMIDLPGNKIRLTGLNEPLRLIKGVLFDIDETMLNFPKLCDYVNPGDIALAHDSIYKLEVMKIIGNTIRFKSFSDGLLTNSKGLHIRGICKDLPFLFPKDLELIEAANVLRIDYLALSFVRNAKDITFAKEIIKKHNNHAQLIAKVETQLAVDNLDEILTQVDSILVDRGDLSADIGIHKLADYQEEIINAAKNKGKKIYLATQFLRNMEKNPLPLIAETIDLYKTIRSGINGIQLSEETAIGAYPVQCVEYIFEAFKGISRKKSQNRTIDNT